MKTKFRSYILKIFLQIVGFRIISGHWLYPKKINQSSIIIDLGANIGNFSKILSQRFRCKCFAIEPNEILLKKIKNKNIIPIHLLVSSKNEEVDFYINSNPEASIIIENFQDLWKNSDKTTVRSITWNRLINELSIDKKIIAVLKMDIEGSELEVIQTFNSTNTQEVEQITVEFHHHLNPELLSQSKDAIKKLINLGYSNISNTISPTEILFIKNRVLELNPIERFFFRYYNKFKFRPFEEY